MAGDGTTFEIDLPVSGAPGVIAGADALDRLASSLNVAEAAASSAADAVLAGEAAYKQAENAADRTAKALERIGLQADAQAGKLQKALDAGDGAGAERAAAKLNALVMRQGEAAQKAAQAAAAVRTEALALDKLRASADQATGAEKKITAAHAAVEKSAKAAAKAADAVKGSGNVKDVAEGLGKLGGPLGSVSQKATGAIEAFQKLGSALGAGGPYVAAAAAIVAITTALVAGTIAVTAWAIGLADGARSARLLSDGIAQSVSGGRELDAAIRSLETRVPQTADELRSMAADLAKTGLKGDALTEALESAAVKAAELKWGPDFAKGTNTLDKLTTRLKTNISGVFGGLNIESLLARLSELVGLFDETSVTGKAIKVVFESLFQPLVDGLTGLIPKIVATFIQFEIWVLKALIAIKPFGSYFVLAAKVIGVAALVIGGVLAVVAGIIVGMAAVAGLLVGGLVYLGLKLSELAVQAAQFGAALIAGPGGALDWLRTKFDQVVAFLSGISLTSIGTAMIDGLVAGITGAAGGILTAMTGAVGGAIDGAKNLLGIASPSKVFADIGMNTGLGMVEGVEASAGDVQGSMTDMVAPPQAAAGGGAAAPAGGGGITINIQVDGAGGNGTSIAQAIRAEIEDFFAGGEAQLGMAVAGNG